MPANFRRAFAGLFSSYGMLGVLVALCMYFSWSTLQEEYPTGREGGRAVANEVLGRYATAGPVLVVTAGDTAGVDFLAGFRQALRGRSEYASVAQVAGDPQAVRAYIEGRIRAGRTPAVIATTNECSQWTLFDSLRGAHPELNAMRVLSPSPQTRSTFLSAGNLRNVADQVAVIAIIAVGMTMVIITGGIDLSVGSLIALAAVLTAWLIRRAGGVDAGAPAMLACCLAAIGTSGLVGAFSGLVVTRFGIPPFIATLAMMQVTSGLAFIVARGQSIYDIPPSFTWLGRGSDLLSLPNAVVLMVLAYALAHVLMTRTALGRAIYAVGGNLEASRLSGVRTERTVQFVYLASGLMAGLGGVITVSQLKAGAPTYGLMYELYVIAAVVVGGTSLSGGEGKVLGTLIGAFIIGVIRNGMNLMNVESYTQKVVLGLVILGAVLLDRLKRRAMSRRTN